MKAITWLVIVGLLFGVVWYGVDPSGRETVLRAEVFLLVFAAAAALVVLAHRRLPPDERSAFDAARATPLPPTWPAELDRLRTDLAVVGVDDGRVGALLRQRITEVAASARRARLGDVPEATLLADLPPLLAAAVRPGARVDADPGVGGRILDELEAL